MKSSGKNILVTGYPGVGKTTLIRRLFDELKEHNPAGFYTAEVREGGGRRGFELVGLADNHRQILSHIDIQSRYRVGKYGVDIAGFDDYLGSSDFASAPADLIIIDEIGKMECFSKIFQSTMRKLLNSDKTIIATIALKGGGLINEVKRRDDIIIFEITRRNRDSLIPEILDQITPARGDGR